MALLWIFAVLGLIASVYAPMLLSLCNCCGCSLTVHVVDCRGTAVSGASVTFTSGATVLSGTTDGSGNATVTAAAGTWTVAASKTNYFGASGSITITCPTGGTINLILKEGDPSTSTGTIYITTGGFTTTLTKLFGVTQWTGASFSYGTGKDATDPACPGGAPARTDFNVSLNAAGCWVVSYTNYYTTSGGGCNLANVSATLSGPCGFVVLATVPGTVSSFTASPLSISGTWASTYNSNPCNVSDPPFASLITGSFSVSP